MGARAFLSQIFKFVEEKMQEGMRYLRCEGSTSFRRAFFDDQRRHSIHRNTGKACAIALNSVIRDIELWRELYRRFFHLSIYIGNFKHTVIKEKGPYVNV